MDKCSCYAIPTKRSRAEAQLRRSKTFMENIEYPKHEKSHKRFTFFKVLHQNLPPKALSTAAGSSGSVPPTASWCHSVFLVNAAAASNYLGKETH